MKNSVRFVIFEYFAYANFIKTLNEYCSNWGGGALSPGGDASPQIRQTNCSLRASTKCFRMP